MNKNKYSYISVVYILILTLISYAGLIVILNTSIPIDYQVIPMLPLMYIFLLLSFLKVSLRFGNSIVCTLIVGMYFIRMVLQPITLALGDFASLNDSIPMSQYFFEGTLLLI